MATHKTISVKPDVHAKLRRACKVARLGTLQNTLDVILDRFLSIQTLPVTNGPGVTGTHRCPPPSTQASTAAGEFNTDAHGTDVPGA